MVRYIATKFTIPIQTSPAVKFLLANTIPAVNDE